MTYENLKEKFFKAVASGQVNRPELMEKFPQQIVAIFYQTALRRCRGK